MSSTPADLNTSKEESLIAMQENDGAPVISEVVHEGEQEKKDVSMEELRVDDENEDENDITPANERKETSDDFLGKQSLLYSDSESDDADKTKNSTTKVIKRIVDSEDETEVRLQNLHKPKKMSALIDSDSEIEIDSQKDIDKAHTDDLENSKDNLKKNERMSKISSLIDSDSESDTQMSPNKFRTPKSKSNNRWKDKIKSVEAKQKSKLTSPYDFESESVSQLNSKGKIIQKEISNKSCLTSDDSGSDSEKSVDDAEHTEESHGPSHENDEHMVKKKQKPMRASAKKALDEMQAIQSEQQRLHREAHISIPYHKPKRHTLQEFLKRHTIIKPEQDGEFSPLSRVVRSKSLKMSTEELEEYAKLMEERAKEATEFFKSESEDEELKDNNSIDEKLNDNNEIVNETEIQNDSLIDNNNTVIATQPENEIEKSKAFNSESIETAPLTKEYLSEENPEPEVTTSLIVTEVIELPKIDINSLHLTPTSLVTQNIKRLIHEKNLPESPSLQGDKNMIIDLETGDLVTKKPTGVDNLFKRFLAAKAGRKPKATETLSILSTENGRLEMSKFNINTTDDTETVEQKPGAAHLKLKENLLSIITKKRRDELEKKKAEKREEELEHNKCLDDDEEEEEEEEEEEDECSETNDDLKSTDYRDNNLDAIEIDEEENDLNMYEDEAIEVDEEDDDEGEETNDESSATKTAQITKRSLTAEVDSSEYCDDIGKVENVVVAEHCDDDADQGSDSDSDSDDNDDEESNQSETGCSSKRKNRIIKAFQDDSDEEIDLLKTPCTQAIMSLTSDKLFNKDTIKNQSDEENELMGLCSGKFDETQKTQNCAFISQIPITQTNIGADVADDELLELCSGTFEEDITKNPTQESDALTSAMPKCNKIISSDEDNTINIGKSEEMKNRIKKLTKRMKKKSAKLGFSDDEDEEITEFSDEESLNEIAANVEDEDEAPQTFIDYDSEENEIVVQMTKKDCFKQAENFFEKEAELSESEWGSADEDEKNLDNYDIELGDEDDFDREKLRTELGQIHARKMLDEDIREVRKLQEMFFEDEEKDGVGRERQFRWKNVESGFSLEDPNGADNKDGENAESGDDENEHLWRKIRYEREQLLKEQGLKESSQDISTTNITDSTSSTTLTGNILTNNGITKKLNIITARKTNSVEVKKSSPFLISKSVAITNKKTVRGSFLVRDKETLSKLAGLTKGGVNDGNRTAGTVSVKDVKPQNFVFATLTEEEHTNLKRKCDDVLNSSNDNGINFMKKPKKESRREKCFIDQLL